MSQIIIKFWIKMVNELNYRKVTWICLVKYSNLNLSGIKSILSILTLTHFDPIRLHPWLAWARAVGLPRANVIVG